MADKLKITGVSIPSSLNAGDTYDIAVTVQNITTTEYLTVAVRAVIQSDAAPWFTPSQQMIWPTGNPSGIPPVGMFVLQGLTMPNQAERVYVQAYYWDGANWVEGAAYAKGPYDIKLIGGTASLYGGVQDIHSNPLTGAKLVLSGPGSYTTYSGSQGNYSFVNFPTGTYTLTITKVGYKTWGPNTYDFSLAGRNYQVFAQLSSLTTVVLGGLVKDKAGNLITGAMLTLDGLTATSDSRGEYGFGSVERKSYTITCKKMGYKDYSASITTDVVGDILRWDIVMEAEPAAPDKVARQFTETFYPTLPKFTRAGSVNFPCPVYLGRELFDNSARIITANAQITITPVSGFTAPERKVTTKYIGFESGVVREKELAVDLWTVEAKAEHFNLADLTPFFYGLGLNMFVVNIATLPFAWAQDVTFRVDITESVVWKVR